MEQTLLRAGTIDPADLSRLALTDSATEAVALIRDRALREFGLSYGPRARKLWFLGER
jgi:hypothetical protein